MIHPLVGLLSVGFTFVVSFYIFTKEILSVDRYFFITILILIGIYTAIAVIRDKEVYQPRRWMQDPLKILGKYAFWGFLIFLAGLIYDIHSFYRETFPRAQDLFKFYLNAYLCLGLPYFILSEKLRYCTSNILNDPYIRILALLRKLVRLNLHQCKRVYANRVYRTFFISSILRLHFIPIMVHQMFFTHSAVTHALQSNFWEYTVIITTLNSFIWSIDANNGAIGYFWESNFTRTRFRQVDPYPMDWLITLICYVPFNIWISTFLPNLVDTTMPRESWFNTPWFTYSTDILILLFLVGYIASGISLYFSTSNLTYKAIQTRGPYAIIRHPATLCKIGYFTVSMLKFAPSHTLLNLFAFILWIAIYVGRTMAEERFLNHIGEYQTYKAKVRYRFVPGLY